MKYQNPTTADAYTSVLMISKLNLMLSMRNFLNGKTGKVYVLAETWLRDICKTDISCLQTGPNSYSSKILSFGLDVEGFQEEKDKSSAFLAQTLEGKKIILEEKT